MPAEGRSYLRTLELEKDSNIVPLPKLFIGTKAKDFLASRVGKHRVVSDAVRKEFLCKVKTAYVMCGKTLQKKLPLDNMSLKVCSALDPAKRCAAATTDLLLLLPTLVRSLPDSDQFKKEARSYSASHTIEADPKQPIDQWWDGLKERYPLLCQGALALLSCFHGPLVESSFSSMSEILDCYSARTSIETFSAIQDVRHYLSAREVTAVGHFSKKEPLLQPIDPKLKVNMINAHKFNERKQAEDKQIKCDREQSLCSTKRKEENKAYSGAPNKEPKKEENQTKKAASSSIQNSQAGGCEEKQDRKRFFSTLAVRLQSASSSSFYDLKCTAKKAEKHLHKFPLECKTFDAKQYAADQSSLSLYPDDAPELVPIEVYGDGNCLPRSASIFESGSQTRHEEMRTRIVVELAAHEDHYLDSNNLDNACNETAKSYAMFSDFYNMETLDCNEIQSIYRKEVCSITRPGSEMGMWQLHAISSILKKKLLSIYPKLSASEPPLQGVSVRRTLHRTIHPRVDGDSSLCDGAPGPAIMWTRLGSHLPPHIWRPNHFVPCLPTQGQQRLPLSCASKRKATAAVSDIRAFFSKKAKQQ